MKSIVRLHLVGFSVLLALGAGCSKEAKKGRYWRSGEKFFAAQDYAKAEVEFLNALRLDPRDLSLQERLGTIYFEQGRLERALMFLLGAEEISPGSTNLCMMLALLHHAGGQAERAREKLAPLLSRDPGYPEAVELLASIVSAPEERNHVRDQIASWQRQVGEKAGFHVALGLLANAEGERPRGGGGVQEGVGVGSPVGDGARHAWVALLAKE